MSRKSKRRADGDIAFSPTAGSTYDKFQETMGSRGSNRPSSHSRKIHGLGDIIDPLDIIPKEHSKKGYNTSLCQDRPASNKMKNILN